MSLTTSRPRSIVAILALQAAFWALLALTFAMLTELSGWSTWRDALAFSAPNWLPWAVMAPLVFWLARRFPLERQRLWRNIPMHVAACVLCCFVMLWIGMYFAPFPRLVRGGMTRETRPPPPGGREFGEQVFRIRPAPEGAGERGERPSRPIEPGGNPERPPLREMKGKGPMPGPGMGGPEFGRRPGGPRPGMPGEGPFWRSWPPLTALALRSNVSAAVYLIIVSLAHAFSYYRRAQEREKEAIALAAGLSRAKLDALRLQLQPHFLFNTLNAISTLVHRDANAADELIGDLSELLRLSLQTSEHEVPLARELELLDCYLAIERARLGDRLKIVRVVDPQALSALVPTFVLQPLAENAIRHGIEPRRGPGTLTLRADIVGGNVRLVVSDDGMGLKPGGQPSARRGIGIANTEQRLRALHGDAAHLDLMSPEAGGVQVQVVLPWRTTPRPEAEGIADGAIDVGAKGKSAAGSTA